MEHCKDYSEVLGVIFETRPKTNKHEYHVVECKNLVCMELSRRHDHASCLCVTKEVGVVTST